MDIPVFGEEEEDKPKKEGNKMTFSMGCEPATQTISTECTINRIINMKDKLNVGMKRNEFGYMRYWMTHSQPFEKGDASLTYEIDNKSTKFLSREKGLRWRFSPYNASWSTFLEYTQRKNTIDKYASRHFIEFDSALQ